MKKLKRFVKDDFKKKLNRELYFDVDKLEDNHKKIRFKWIVVTTCLASIFILLVYFASSVLETKDSFSKINRKYSLDEIKLIEESTFKKINPDNFPDSSWKNNTNSEEYINALYKFSNTIYHNAENKGINFSFSPMGLYSTLNTLSYASVNAEEELDTLLGLTQNEREIEFKKMVENNYFSNSDGVVQLNNAAFFTNKYLFNEEYVERLTANYVEAYQLDFLKDSSKIKEWADKRIHEKNYLKDEEFYVDDYTALCILSTLYFDNHWYHQFATSKTKTDEFYLENNETVSTKYMQTTYFGNVYDRGDFISCDSYYKNGYHIEYFVPKNIEDNIYDLTKDYDLFSKVSEENTDYSTIEISVPKISSACSFDFTDTLKKVGLVSSFDSNSKAFNKAFKNLDDDVCIYLDEVKQKNKISFNEDGTIIKSLTIGVAKSNSMYFEDGQYKIKLNQPYIYIIYDCNNIPLYIGNVDNPNK